MARDIFVNWPDGAPDKATLLLHIEEYLNGLGELKWDQDRWFITLPQGERLVRMRDDYERWIEVWPSPTSVDVMTRLQDTITNVIAEGLAQFFVRRLDGVYADHNE